MYGKPPDVVYERRRDHVGQGGQSRFGRCIALDEASRTPNFMDRPS